MVADTRLFRITRARGRIEYGNRQVAGNKTGRGGESWHHGRVIRVEATNAEATEGWTDVTDEFMGEER